MAGTILTLASIAEENSAASEQMAATGEEIHRLVGHIATKTAEELSAHAVQLDHLVAALTTAVSRFRL